MMFQLQILNLMGYRGGVYRSAGSRGKEAGTRGKKVRFRNIYLKEVQSVEERVEDDEAPRYHLRNLNRLFILTSIHFEGRYEFAGEETNTYRTMTFTSVRRNITYKKDQELNLLPAYTDLDGGIFGTEITAKMGTRIIAGIKWITDPR